jgi:septum formation protein
MKLKNLERYKIILASRSPRRHHLLEELGIDFDICQDNGEDEEFPPHLKQEEIPVFLAEKKMHKMSYLLKGNHLVITADTIVWLNGEVIGKPIDLDDASRMLSKLSGNMHTVFTGVCIATAVKKVSFYSKTEVYFRKLAAEEIDYYVNHFKPLDKAGSYGVQEWIGYIGVERIDGSFYNVMGLPVQNLFVELSKF